MKLRTLYPASIGVCLTFLTLSAGGQTTTDNASHDAVTPGKAATAGATTSAAGKSAVAPASNTQEHHATAHHKTHAKHKRMATASPASNQDTAYHAALKHCVAGPAGQRESCLDDTIARFGRA